MDQSHRTSDRPVTARTAAPGQQTGRATGQPRKKTPPKNVWIKNRALRRTLLISGLTLGPLLALAGIIVGLLYFRLSQGPISLQPLVASIENGISADLDGITAKIDDALVVMNDDGRIEFRLKSLKLLEPDGDLVASAPLASAAVSTTDLFKLRITPKRVFLIEPRVFLFYSDEGGLAMSFSGSSEGAAEREIVPPAPVPAQRPNGTVIAKTTSSVPTERIDLARKLVDLNQQAQRGIAASKLREIGLKDASVVLVFAGQTSEWKVPNFVIDLDRSRTGSSITGKGTVDSGHGEWNFGFRTEEAAASNTVKLKLEVADFVPSTLAEAVPRLALFKTMGMRVAGEGSVDLTAEGNVAAAKLDLAFGRGNINLPNVAQPLLIDEGTIGLSFDGGARVLTVAPSTFKWGASFLTLAGSAEQLGTPASGDTQWRFALDSRDGALAAEDLAIAPIPVDALHLAGRLTPKTGVIELAEASLRTGGGEITAKGEITSGDAGSSTRIEGRVANLKLDSVKTLWPTAFAPGARNWVGSKLSGDVRTGTMNVVSGDYLTAGGKVEPGTTQRTSFAIEAAALKVKVVDGVAPMVAPRALIRGENGNVELTIPEADLPAGPKGSIQVRNAKLTATDLGTVMPTGDLTFRLASPLHSALEAVRKIPDSPLTGVDLPLDNVDGKIDAQMSVKLPLIDTVQRQQMTFNGKARLTDVKVKPKTGNIAVQGGTITLDLTDTLADAKGDLIINGVVAKLLWQHPLNVPDAEAPLAPLKITASLDGTDRTQLGLDINHMVQGEVPLEITVQRQPDGENAIKVKADLTAAELYFEDVAWTKPASRHCGLELDVGKTRPDGRVELQNIRMTGDDLAIEGHALLDPDNEMRDFTFPRFSLGLISRMELTGKQNPKDKIWTIKAKGSTYDGKSFFDSLFNLNSGRKVKPLRPASGTDVEAEIGTVLGYQESSLKNFKLKMSTRKEKIVELETSAQLEGGRSFKAVIPRGDRRLLAESNDAGRMFKVVGFYPNAESGDLRMEVELDGSGPAERTGTLVVENFQVLGEQVFNELASSGQGQQRIQREVIEFDRMRIPFSVGHGQFVLSESYLRGPVMGMTLRGRIDYKLGRVNLGGTYIPLQGVNAAICDLPIFGQIVAGANCEGILGITFALQGSNKNPQVIVNPLSIVAPGIFRDIFAMTAPNPKIQERDDGAKTPEPSGKGTRNSSSGATSGDDVRKKPRAKDTSVDGWSSTESTPPGTKKR